MRPDQREQAQHVVGHVDLPPAEALVGRALVVVVVVVPPLAGREQREQPVVARVVGGVVAALAEHVRQRVDRKRAVPEQHRRDEVAPDERVRAADEEERQRQRDRRHHVPSPGGSRKRSSG